MNAPIISRASIPHTITYTGIAGAAGHSYMYTAPRVIWAIGKAVTKRTAHPVIKTLALIKLHNQFPKKFPAIPTDSTAGHSRSHWPAD